MRAFGARGSVSPQQKKSMDAFLRKCVREHCMKQRAEIAVLSNVDIQTRMASVIIDGASRNPPGVERRDFHQAGLPDHRLDQNMAGAMRRARKHEPRLDAMMARPCAA